VLAASLAQTPAKLLLVLNVSNQIAAPRPKVKIALIVTPQPCTLSQPLLFGKKRAGRLSRKVRKTKMALTMPAVRGHWERRRCGATVLMVGVARMFDSEIRTKARIRAPMRRKRMSRTTYMMVSLFAMAKGVLDYCSEAWELQQVVEVGDSWVSM